MLRLNVNETKQLTFEVQIGGVHGKQIDSFFRIVIEDIEYGFPAKVGGESIVVDLPPLNQVIGKKIKEGDEAKVKLEIIADGHYLTAWSDRAKLSNSLVVEAKIIDSGFVSNPTVEVKSVKMESIKENCGMKHVKEEADEKDETDEPPPLEDQENVEEDSPVTATTMEKILTQTISKLGLHTEGSKTTKKKKKITLEQFKKKLTQEDIYKYIERAGTKNPQIQEIVYEQAVLAAGNNKPVEVLRQVINIMKKKKS